MKFVPKYVEEYQDSGINCDLAEMVWDCFQTEDVDLRVTSSIEVQRAFVRGLADRRGEADVESAHVVSN